MRVLTAVIVLAAGCFDPDYPANLACPEGVCPPGERCWSDGTCHAEAEPDAGAADAAPPDGVATWNLRLRFPGTGAGSVSVTPAPGTTCASPTSCSWAFPQGTWVTLSATASSGSQFTGWSVASCTGSVCSFTISADMEVNATFQTIETLTVSRIGNGCGTVTFSGGYGPTSCSLWEPCEREAVRGTVVSVSVAPCGATTFGGWGGSCSGTGSCAVTMNGSRTVTASLTSEPNHAFVTSATVTLATLNPSASTSTPAATILANADAVCQNAANAAGLPSGTYVAYLSAGTTDARDRLGAERGWVGVDHQPFGNTVSEMLDDYHTFHPIVLDENGGDRTGGWVVTASYASGSHNLDCQNFSSTAAADKMNKGVIGAGSGYWSGSWQSPCSSLGTMRLLCLGLGRPTEVTITPSEGRHAFVSRTSHNGALGGLIGADNICQADAVAYGHPGVYRAALASSGRAAFDHTFFGGSPWVRSDGLVVAQPGNLPALVLPLGHDAADEAVFWDMWTGSQNLPDVGDLTCDDWTSSASADQGRCTEVADPGSMWWNRGWQSSCDQTRRLFCFESGTSDFANQFQNVNPNGVWQYGKSASVGGTFVRFTNLTTPTEKIVWSDGGAGSANIFRNVGASALGGWDASGAGILHPSQTGEYAVVRYTAPAAQTCYVTVLFWAGNSGETDGHVLRNGVVVSGGSFSATSTNAHWDGPLTFTAGSTLDVAVGSLGDWTSDGTPVDVVLDCW